MKFGKSIRAEARNNRSLAFINFKYLKRILKRCASSARARAFDTAKLEDRQFSAMLESELRKVSESYWKELQQISNLQVLVSQTLPMLDVQPDPDTYTRMGFEELQAHLQSLGGLDKVPVCSDCPVSTSVKTSAALCEFCINLGKISARCKHMRRCVLWNAVAVVKILKKREKHRASSVNMAHCFPAEEELQRETAAQVLARQDWYCSDRLPKIVSIVETTTDELMQRLTSKPPNRDQYECPICLDVVVDPVCLRTCGHRFCWACLCMAYCEKPEGTLERCPCCRCAFPLHPEAFEVDGILSRFLRDFFPEDQSAREKEQKENLRQHLEVVQRQHEKKLDQQDCLLDQQDSLIEEEDSDNHHHCCPDCLVDDDDTQQLMTTKITAARITNNNNSNNNEEDDDAHDDDFDIIVESSAVSQVDAPKSLMTNLEVSNKLSPMPIQRTIINEPLMRSAAEWLTSSREFQDNNATQQNISSRKNSKRVVYCHHELNVKQGNPSDVVDRFTSNIVETSSGLSLSSASDALLHYHQHHHQHNNSNSSNNNNSNDEDDSSPSAWRGAGAAVLSLISPRQFTPSSESTLMSPLSVSSGGGGVIGLVSPAVSSSCIRPLEEEEAQDHHPHPGNSAIVDSVVSALMCETLPHSAVASPLLFPGYFDSSIKESCRFRDGRDCPRLSPLDDDGVVLPVPIVAYDDDDDYSPFHFSHPLDTTTRKCSGNSLSSVFDSCCCCSSLFSQNPPHDSVNDNASSSNNDNTSNSNSPTTSTRKRESYSPVTDVTTTTGNADLNLSDCFLPPVIVDQQMIESATMITDWMILLDNNNNKRNDNLVNANELFYYNEAIDDKDDQIEEEYLVMMQQKQQQQQQHYSSSRYAIDYQEFRKTSQQQKIQVS